MSLKSLLPPIAIGEIFAQSWNSGQISRQNRYKLKWALLVDWLSEEELAAIDRLVHAVKRGWLRISD